MSTRACAGIWVLSTAVALGVLGDLLLRGAPWSLGAFIWFALLLTGSAVLARTEERRIDRQTGWRSWNLGRHRAVFAYRNPRYAEQLDRCSTSS